MRDQDGIAPDGPPNIASEPSRSGLDTSSVYDSLLRGAAAAYCDVEIDREVGPSGRFVLQQEIGRGGMGRVYRALDRHLLRDVAIKFIFRPDGMDVAAFTALFWQEARIIARLDQHDNIVRIFDVDPSTYPPFIVMEYLDGQTLADMLKRGPIDPQTGLRIMISVARGLQKAHARGVFHRDLKPSNIFVLRTGGVKLLDFGLAQLRGELAGSRPDQISGCPAEGSGVGARSPGTPRVPSLLAAGTPAYMAPEQWRGEEANAATDLWALGAILYRMLANSPPFAGDSMAALSAQVLSGEPPAPLGTLCSTAPMALRQLIERLLRADHRQRPCSASEVTAALVSVLRTMLSGAEPGTARLARDPGARHIASGKTPMGGTTPKLSQ